MSSLLEPCSQNVRSSSLCKVESSALMGHGPLDFASRRPCFAVKSPLACSPLAFPPGLIPTAPRLQIAAADENRSVRLRAASKIFAARCLLAGRPVGPEYLQLFFAVSPKMVIQRSEEHTSELQSHHDLVCR